MKPGLISLLGMFLTVMTFIGPVLADAQIGATVDRTRIVAGESIQLRVTVTGGDTEVDTSAIEDFEVHSRGTSSHIQFINGRMSREVVYSYLLIPRRQGTLSIPALMAEIDGQEYRTTPITITVAQHTSDDQGKQGRDVYVTAGVSEESPFVGSN